MNQEKLLKLTQISLTGLLGVLTLASLLGIFSTWSSWAFFCDQIRGHYLLVSGLCLILALALKWKIPLALALVVLIQNLLIVPLHFKHSIPANAPSVSILHLNLGKQAQPSEKLLAWVEQKQPQLLCLQEVTTEFAKQLPEAYPDYQILLNEPRQDTLGITILCKQDFAENILASKIRSFLPEKTNRPQAEISFQLGEEQVRLLSYHATRPRNALTFALQREEQAALANWFQESPHHALAVGDFNASPSSSGIRQLVRDAGLPKQQSALSLRPTWPAKPWTAIGLPLDFALHSSELIMEAGLVWKTSSLNSPKPASSCPLLQPRARFDTSNV